MSFLGCKSSCILISFLVLWSICWSSYLVHFKNGSGAGPFNGIFVIEFAFQQFSHFPEIHFLIFFFHLLLFDGVLFQYSQLLVSFLFSERFDFFLVWLFYFFHQLFFTLLIISIVHFSIPNSILISWLYILIVCNRVFNSFSFLTTSLMSLLLLLLLLLLLFMNLLYWRYSSGPWW